jgi:hypothetical protein
MVMRYGMTDALGPMVYAENEGEVFLGRSVTKTTNMSEQTMQKVDAEVRRIIDEQYNLARRLIEENSDKMHAMAKACSNGKPSTASSSTTSWPARRRVRPRTGRRARLRPRVVMAPGGGRLPLPQRSSPHRRLTPGTCSLPKRGLRPRFCWFLAPHEAHALANHPFHHRPGRPQVMGIVNVTPDSFSDGGRHARRPLRCATASSC